MLVADQLRQRPTSGIATYTRGLLQGLGAMGNEAPAVTLAASRPPSPDPLEVWGRPIRSSRLPGPFLVRWWDLGRGSGLFAGAGVVHAPSLATPPSGAAALVVTVHDLAWRE